MTDTISPEQRSRNMSAIHSQNTKPEIYLRKLLFSKGFRYSLNSKKVPGHPDIYMRKYNTAIFVHGCFWHRHCECKYAYTPKSRVEFWMKKFSNNQKRDIEVKKMLSSEHIKQLIIWECTIKQMHKSHEKERDVLARVELFLESEELYLEL